MSEHNLDEKNNVRCIADKIRPLEKIKLESDLKTVVLAHGVFDVLHLGHMKHLEQAKSWGDVLVVTITGDKFANRKTVFDQNQRAFQVACLGMVDYVAIVHDSSALKSICTLKPDIYTKGSEYQNLLADPSKNIIEEKKLVEEFGGKLKFTDTPKWSSTKIGHITGIRSEAQNDVFSGKSIIDLSHLGYKIEQITEFLARAQKLSVGLFGESITDIFTTTKPISISSHSKCIAGEITGTKVYRGGVDIVADHLASFVQSITLYKNEEPIIKERFIDGETGKASYEIKSIRIGNTCPKEVNLIPFNLALFYDFGHGFFDTFGYVTNKDKCFWGVQMQSNSSNYGFHTVPMYEYRLADYYSVNSLEAELAIGRHEPDPHILLYELGNILPDTKHVDITLGSGGVIGYSKHESKKIEHLPALTNSVVDSIGCGDAYMAFSSLALTLGMVDIHWLVGSIAAAIVAQHEANSHAITPEEFLTFAKIVI